MKACIRSNNIKTVSGVNEFAKCKDLCVGHVGCFSIDYNYVKDSCNLNLVNQATVQPSSYYSEPCYANPSENWYAERIPRKTISFRLIVIL